MSEETENSITLEELLELYNIKDKIIFRRLEFVYNKIKQLKAIKKNANCIGVYEVSNALINSAKRLYDSLMQDIETSYFHILQNEMVNEIPLKKAKGREGV